MHFYLLTEINRQPTKIENFNRLPTSGPHHSDPRLSVYTAFFDGSIVRFQSQLTLYPAGIPENQVRRPTFLQPKLITIDL